MDLEYLQTYFLCNATCFLLFVQLDYFLRYIKVKCEWYQLHAIGNGLVVASTWHDVVSCLQNHEISSSPPKYPYAGPLVLSLYLYQCISGKTQYKDRFYNLYVLFQTPIGYINNSKTMSMMYFFCNGYPSLVDYTFISMVSNGFVSKRTQRLVYITMNNYVRKPGTAIAASFLMYDAFSSRGIEDKISMFYPNIALSFCVYYKYATSRTRNYQENMQ